MQRLNRWPDGLNGLPSESSPQTMRRECLPRQPEIDAAGSEHPTFGCRGLLHDLYARLLRKCRDEDRRPEMSRDREWFAALGREALAALRQDIPPPSDEVFEREVQGIVSDLELFLTEESGGDGSRTPVALEVSFGRGSSGEEPLDRAEPVVIDLGNGLRFRLAGRIDRIDRLASGEFEIVDYKTGGFFRDDWQGVFAGGTRLQHALYGIAAVELLRAKYGRPTIAGGVYYFPSAKGRQEKVPIPEPTKSATTAVLRDLRRVIASGVFIHASEESACKFCDFGAACGTDPRDRANEKQDDPLLAPYRNLVAHD